MIELIKTDSGVFRLNNINNLRAGIAAKTINKIDYSEKNEYIRDEEKKLISAVSNIEKKNIIMLNQVHSDQIVIIDGPILPDEKNVYYATADGVITNQKKICIVIRTADCVPVLIFDTKNNILGAVHSGWKGCKLDITGKSIKRMISTFSAKLSDLHAYIFPSIGPDSYVINKDVAKFFENNIIYKNGDIYLNLWDSIEKSILNAGIDSSKIYKSNMCTLKSNESFFSHRNGDSGRNLNFFYIA